MWNFQEKNPGLVVQFLLSKSDPVLLILAMKFNRLQIENDQMDKTVVLNHLVTQFRFIPKLNIAIAFRARPEHHLMSP